MKTAPPNYTVENNEVVGQLVTETGFMGELNSKLLHEGISLPDGFFLTNESLIDFLRANDIYNPLIELISLDSVTELNSKSKLIEEIQVNVQNGVIPPSIHQEMQESYDALGYANSDTHVVIKPSLGFEILEKTSVVSRISNSLKAGSLSELEDSIKQLWSELFSFDNFYELTEKGLWEQLIFGVYIQRQNNAEISGVGVSFNPLSKNPEEVEIEAVFGNFMVVKKEGILPDRYVVSKEQTLINEKHCHLQEKMYVSVPSKATGKTELREVEISKPWQNKPKLNDRTLHLLTKEIVAVEKVVESHVYINWEYEAGRMLITSIEVSDFDPGKVQVQHVKPKDATHKFSKSYTEDILDAAEMTGPPVPELLDEKKDAEQTGSKKSIDDLVHEIKLDLQSSGNFVDLPPVETNLDSYDLGKDVKKTQKEKEVAVAKKAAPKRSKHKGAAPQKDFWRGVKLDSGRDDLSTVTNFWVDVKSSDYNFVANKYLLEGVAGIYASELEDAYEDLGSKGELSEFKENAILGLSSITNDFPIVYSIDLASKNYESDFVAIKHLRNHHNLRKLWIKLNNLKDLNELWDFYKKFSGSGLRRSSTLKVLLSLDRVPALMNIQKIMEERLNGIVLDFEAIVEELFGTEANLKEIFENKMLWFAVDQIKEHANKSKSGMWVKSTHLLEYKDLLQKFLEYGVTDLIVPAKQIDDLAFKVAEFEVSLLNTIKKKTRKRKK